MSDKYKPAYRKPKKAFGGAAKIIIVLAVVLVITVGFVIFKNVIKKELDPGIVYPPSTDAENSAAANQTADVSADAETEKSDAAEPLNIDMKKYGISKGSLVLANAENPYDIPDGVTLLALEDEVCENFKISDGIRLSSEAYGALCSMADGCKSSEGYCPLLITDAYSDTKDNDHGTGLGFDVKLSFKDGKTDGYSKNATSKALWIFENHKYYGFVMRYPVAKSKITKVEGEYDHFRYVGVPHSVYMEDNGLCLEEYLELIKTKTQNDPLKVTVNGIGYEVWYTADGEAEYTVYGKTVSVSGDNTGGFIITVEQ